MKFNQLPKSIQDHYAGRVHEIDKIRVISTTGKNHGGGEGYNVIMVAFGAADRWRFCGEKGAKKWSIIG